MAAKGAAGAALLLGSEDRAALADGLLPGAQAISDAPAGLPVQRIVELAVSRPNPANPAAAPDVAVLRAFVSGLDEFRGANLSLTLGKYYQPVAISFLLSYVNQIY